MAIPLTIVTSKALAALGTPESRGSGQLTEYLVALLVMTVLFLFIPSISLSLDTLRGIFVAGKENSHANSTSGK